MKYFFSILSVALIIFGIAVYKTQNTFPDASLEGRELVASFQGKGNEVVGPFRPKEKMGIFSIQHKTSDPDSLLNVSLYQDTNKNGVYDEGIDLLSVEVFSIGLKAAQNFSGERARKLGVENFFLKIESKGKWKIEVLQPNVSEQVIFSEVTGKSHRVTPFYYFEASTQKFALHHDGLSTFQVQAYDILGGRVNFLADEFAVYDGESEITFPVDGFYTFGVIADGNWSITSLGEVNDASKENDSNVEVDTEVLN